MVCRPVRNIVVVELKGVGKFVKMTWILKRPQCLVCCHVRCLQWLVEHGGGHNNPGPEWLYTTAAIRRTNKQLDVHGGTLFSP